MGKVKEPDAVYAVEKKLDKAAKPMQAFTHYLFDSTGKKIGVQIDLESYEKLLEAKEELEDLREFDESVNPALEALKMGNIMTLKDYQLHRKSKTR